MKRSPTMLACPLLVSLLLAGANLHAQAPVPAPGQAEPPTLDADMSLPSAEQQFKQVADPIAPHVHAIHPRVDFSPAPHANQMLVEQADGFVLVDAGKTRGDGLRIVALIRSIGSKPVKAVILTHWHQDHVLGLGPIIEAWPKAAIIASAATRDRIATDPSYKGTPRAGEDTAEHDALRAKVLRGYAAQYDASIRDPKLTPRERQGWADLVGVLSLRIADERGTYLVLPTVTVSDHYVIPDRDAPVEARFIGPAHTLGDIVVWTPKQRVLAAGDMVVTPIPFGGEDVLAWPETLKKLEALHPATIVPGHGPVLRGTAFVDKMIAAITEMRMKAKALASGPALTDEQVQAKADLSTQKKVFAGDDPWLGYWFDQYFGGNVAQAYGELRKQAVPAPAK